MIHIGIDNGVSGGMVALGQCGSYIAGIPMPVQRWRNRNEVDIRAVRDWLSEITDGFRQPTSIAIEEPNNSRTPSIAYSVASSFHSIRGLLVTKDLVFHRVTPQSWQKAMLGKVPAGETKPFALARAYLLWPHDDFRASKRCKTPHDGMIDAALIAEFCRTRLEKTLVE